MSQPKNLCFYSNKCKWSAEFLEQLKETPWMNLFRFICVDPSPNRPKLPTELKKVPSLIIEGEDHIREDMQVMGWIYEMKMKNNKISPTNLTGDGIEEWNDIEHQSFTDGLSYAYTDSDTLAQGNGGERIKGAFEYLNGSSAPGDKTSQQLPPGRSGDQTKQQTKKEAAMKVEFDQYLKNRDVGMPTFDGRQR